MIRVDWLLEVRPLRKVRPPSDGIGKEVMRSGEGFVLSSVSTISTMYFEVLPVGTRAGSKRALTWISALSAETSRMVNVRNAFRRCMLI